jgi:hypothetical protein
MQTNSAWTSVFQFVVGNPPIPFSLATWTLIGTATRTNMPNKAVDLANKMSLMDDTSQLMISLVEDDTSLLGVGRIVFEVLRTDPGPQRPILKFYVENHAGVVIPPVVMPV